MRLDKVVRGGLFSDDFLGGAIAESADWQAFDEAVPELTCTAQDMAPFTRDEWRYP